MPREKVVHYWDRDTETNKQHLNAVAGAHNRAPSNARLIINLEVITDDPALTLLELFNANQGKLFSHPENPPVRICNFKIERITDENRNDAVFGDGKACAHCGSRFETRHKRAMYCSKTCKQKAYYKRKEIENGDQDIEQE